MAADKTQELRKINLLVKAELLENPSTRRDDCTLINNVLQRMGVDTNESFASLAKSGKLRQMASITRCRRKWQEKCPELKDPTVTAFREEKQEIFKKFAADQL